MELLDHTSTAQGPGKYHVGNDIVLVLKPRGKAKDSRGLVDSRLFTGENKLHAIRDHQTSLWGLQYEQGTIPPVLMQRFTTFQKLLTFAKDYFIKRNIELEEDYGQRKESSEQSTTTDTSEKLSVTK